MLKLAGDLVGQGLAGKTQEGSEADPFVAIAFAEAYLRQAGMNLLGAWSAMIGGAIILIGRTPLAYALSWLAVYLVLIVWQTRKRLRARSVPLTETRARRLLARAPVGSGAMGLAWGLSAAALLYVPLEFGAALTVITMGLALIAAVTLAAVPRAAYAFILCAVTPYFIVLVLIGTFTQIVLLFLGLIFLAAIFFSMETDTSSLRHELDARRAAVDARLRLNDSQAMWSQLSRSAEAFALFDAEARLLLFNDAYRRVLGAGSGAMKTGTCWEALSAPRKEQVAEHRFFTAGEPIPPHFREVAPIGDRWYRSSMDLSSDGHLAVTHVDVTELKTNEQTLLALKDELVQARDRAEAASHAKSQFLAKMSHELRTPLNAVIGFADLTLQDFERERVEPERHRNYARIISDSGHHLLAIVEDILDFARIEEGGTKLNEEVIEIAALVGSARELLMGRFSADAPLIEERLPSAPLQVRVDARLLRQAFVNLLMNAAKFTDDPPARIAIRVERTDAGAVRIEVADQGIGIAADQLEAVQTPFAQVERSEARRYGGAGLGLPLAKQFAILHGGEFELRSVLGEGTKAAIILPKERVCD